jgi:hypothetical protein
MKVHRVPKKFRLDPAVFYVERVELCVKRSEFGSPPSKIDRERSKRDPKVGFIHAISRSEGEERWARRSGVTLFECPLVARPDHGGPKSYAIDRSRSGSSAIDTMAIDAVPAESGGSARLEAAQQVRVSSKRATGRTQGAC